MIPPVRDYETALSQIAGVLEGENDPVANMANVAAVLKTLEGFFWVGFYMVQGRELVLGPFQGPVACTRIPFGRGVCGAAWCRKETIVVPDVHLFPGHIACNAASQSEIVVPVRDHTGEVVAVLDADSNLPNAFGTADAEALQRVAHMLSTCLS
jgi:GAF domain-containing protein